MKPISIVRDKSKKVSTLLLFARGTKLKYQVIENNFSKTTCAQIREDMESAIRFMGLNALFNEVRGQNQAPHIRIIGIRNDGIYASSFFPPNSGDLALTEHFASLCKKRRRQVLQHELGHIIGFRHEHAQTEDQKFVNILGDDPKSFMSSALNGLSAKDCEVIKMLYIDYDDTTLIDCLKDDIRLKRCLPKQSKKVF